MLEALDGARRHYSEWFMPYPWAELKLSEDLLRSIATDLLGTATVTYQGESYDFGKPFKRLSVFDSTGFALEDDVAMQVLLEQCEQLGLGLELDLEAVGEDPLNPYDFGTGAAREMRIRRPGG